MDTLGLYLHIPFCASKCSYCDFYSFPTGEQQMDDYITAMQRSLEDWSHQCKEKTVDTIYFGGGTPSYLGGNRLTALLSSIYRFFSVQKDAEITVECNPDSMNHTLLAALRQAGVNRLSIGVQAMQDEMLQMLGRRHTAQQAKQAVSLAKSFGFTNLSLDLMYGLPGQTVEMVVKSAKELLALDPTHLSCYALKVEPNTPLAAAHPVLPDEDITADMYEAICHLLQSYGYGHYEISNWAKSGYHAKHNARYWDLSEYIGIGPSAHSLWKGKRWEYPGDIAAFCAGASPIPEEEVEGFSAMQEFIMLSLRTAKGINPSEFEQKFGVSFAPIAHTLERYLAHGLTVCSPNRYALTETGFLVSNPILSDVLASVE